MSTVNYLLRNIDPRLWHKFKVRAAKDRLPMRTVLMRLLASYVKDGLT